MLNPTDLRKNTALMLDAANDIINASIENIEKLANLNIQTSKNAIEESTSAFKHLAAITTPQEALSYTKNLATTTATKNAEVCRNAYEILTATNSKITKIWQDQATQLNTDGFTKLLNTFQTPKFGFDASAMTTWVNSFNQTFAEVSSLVNEASQLSRNNFLAATDTVKTVVNTAKAAAAHSAQTAKKAASETLATAKIAAAENLVTAKKATAETLETVIKSAKVAQAQAVEVAQKSAEAIVAATKKSANLVNAATKKAVK